MSLAKSLGIPPEQTPRSRCPVNLIASQLNGTDRAALIDAMMKIREGTVLERKIGGHAYTASWLAQKLNENGHKINQKSVARHINGRCACGTL